MKQDSMKRLPVGVRLGVFFGLFSLLLAFTISVLVGMQSANQLRETQKLTLRDLAFQVANKLDRGLYERMSDIKMLVNLNLMRNPKAPAAEKRVLLENLQESFPEYAWIGLTDWKGNVTASTKGLLEGKDVSKRPWFTEGAKGLWLGDVHEALLLAKLLSPETTGEPLRFVDVTAPVMGSDGKPLGVLGAHLSWGWAKTVRDSVVQKLEKEQKVQLFILSREGQILLGPSGFESEIQHIFRQVQSVDNPALVELETETQAHQGYLVGAARTGTEKQGQDLGWTVIVRQQTDVALLPARDLQNRILIVGFCLGLAFAMVGAFYGHRLVKPFTRLAQAARRVKEGKDPEFPLFDSADEAGDLAHALRDLFESVERNRSQLQKFNANLQATVDERTNELLVSNARLTTSESKMRSIMETALDAIIATDQDGLIISWNEGATAIFGYRAEEALGRDFMIIVPARLRESTKHGMNQVVTTGGSKLLGRRVELMGLRKDGSELDVDLSLACWKGPASPGSADTRIFFTAVFRDITTRKQTDKALVAAREQAEHAANAKSQFLAQMSHEIRTPLNGVIGMTQILIDTKLTDEQRDYANTVLDSSEGLLAIINDVLDFSKVDAGKLDLEQVIFDPATMLSETVKSFAVAASRKGIGLSVKWMNEPPKTLNGDPGRLRQVLNNLLGNAIKFTEKGEVKVRVQAEAHGKKAELSFEIEDTGIGISKESVNRLFLAFSQADSSMSRRFGGTGLGLSICKKLVRLMDGDIGVRTEAGKGSTFWFKVTMELGPAVTDSRVDDSAPAIASWPARILVAEDNPVNLRIAMMMLTKAGYRPQGVGNGNEVLDALANAHYDLILMDCQMPELDGFEATRIIRTSDTINRRTIPIVALTANAVQNAAQECLDAGMNDFVSKPVKIAELVRVVEKHLPAQGSSSGSGLAS